MDRCNRLIYLFFLIAAVMTAAGACRPPLRPWMDQAAAPRPALQPARVF